MSHKTESRSVLDKSPNSAFFPSIKLFEDLSQLMRLQANRESDLMEIELTVWSQQRYGLISRHVC